FSIGSKGIRSARVYVVGLGFYELSVNGAKVGDNVLSPAWTDYEKRVLYDTFDVTKFLKEGKNAVGISLGTGRYEPAKESDLARAGYGPVKALLQLNIKYEDGTIQSYFSDPSLWKCSDGPFVSDDLFMGETYDARREKPGWDTPEYNEVDFRACQPVAPPKGTLVSSATLPPSE
ncbi:MAG: alpha-L-rhamnosidase N-terminal domain-containing protein, partial [Nitrososphaerales archaeon]